MTASFGVNGLVLRRAPWRDYDRMVTILTAQRGLLDCVVRGCRRPKSPLLPASEPFVCGQMQIYEANERMSVTEIKVTDGFYPLREDMDRLNVGAGWLKLIEKVSLPDQPAKELFDLAIQALSYLAYSELEDALLNAMFLMKLTNLLGLRPVADRCAVCGKSVGERILGFSASRGGCVCLQCVPNATPLSEGARRILLKAPKAPYKSVELLNTHPDWREARARIEEFVQQQIG